VTRRIRFRRGLETVDIAFPRWVPPGEFGGGWTWDDPVIMETHKVPVKPISTRDWPEHASTISVVAIYFPSTARFDWPPPDPGEGQTEPNPGLFLRIRGRRWNIQGDPETWRFGGMPHIKVTADREGAVP
jgi:hypothetical protein